MKWEREVAGPHTVLVVDDDLEVRRLFRRILARRGLRVLEAGRGDEALGLGRDHPLDLVILDLRLPDRDGLEVLKGLRDTLEGLPVIVLTGYARLASMREAMLLGAYDYVTKPFDVRFVTGIVLEALGGRIEASPVPGRGEKA